MFVFSRGGAAIEEQKFGAKQANTFGTMFQRCLGLVGLADGGPQRDFSAVGKLPWLVVQGAASCLCRLLIGGALV